MEVINLGSILIHLAKGMLNRISFDSHQPNKNALGLPWKIEGVETRLAMFQGHCLSQLP